MISNRANSQVRAPAVAGTFYPRSAKTLSATVADLLFAADVDQRPRRCGVIAPHAGFAYSGLPAAHAFASEAIAGSSASPSAAADAAQ